MSKSTLTNGAGETASAAQVTLHFFKESEVTPIHSVLIRLGRLGDEPGLVQLWRRSGEGAVEIRSIHEVTSAILDNRLLVIEANGEIVGTASYFIRQHGPETFSIEMGALTIAEDFRHRGLAQLMATCRLMMVLPGWDNAPVLAEVYPSSHGSLRYLFRIGFQPLDRVPFALHEAAHGVNSHKPVIYMVADPMAYRSITLSFTIVERDGHTHGPAGHIAVKIDPSLMGFATHVRHALKAEYSLAAFENHDRIGVGLRLSPWLARHFGSPCITRSAFLNEKGLEADSWGYHESEIDGLAHAFKRTLKGAAANS